MKITSPAFQDKHALPVQFTCDGEKISPPLEFGYIPPNAKSLVLLVEDPDVPRNIREDGMWDHWVVFNIPPTVGKVETGQTPEGLVGLSTSGNVGYDAACPPNGEHRYFFKLFALDRMLEFDDPAKVTKKMVQDAMVDAILEQAELIGTYKRRI